MSATSSSEHVEQPRGETEERRDRQVIALVDYDNVKPSEDRVFDDAVQNADEILEALASVAAGVEELQVRLYGGWIDERGQFTRRADWLLRGIPSLARRRHGVRLFPSLATCLRCRPTATLVGTLRGVQGVRGQKMVDTMIAVDATHFASEGQRSVVVASDDDDLVPALLAASIGNVPISVMRFREHGGGLNDHHCSSAGVRFLKLPWENRP